MGSGMPRCQLNRYRTRRLSLDPDQQRRTLQIMAMAGAELLATRDRLAINFQGCSC
jgi:hypothetical protein